jgi:carbon-monoxide dehydrogenase small subunit
MTALRIPITLVLNTEPITREIDGRSLLVDTIREYGGLSARIGCLTGDCGACTVLVDGRLTKSCLTLSVASDGSHITTLEGSHSVIAEAVKQGFVDKKGFQCGYCTSGMIMVATEFLKTNPNPTHDEIRQAISGNLCRCTGYDDIVSSIGAAAQSLRMSSTIE